MDFQRALPGFTYKVEKIVWPFAAISTTIFFMRLIPRLPGYRNRIPLDWDDLLIVVAWAFRIAMAAFLQKSLSSSREITPEDMSSISSAAFWVIFVDAWAYISVSLPKLAIGFLLIRIFRPTNRVQIIILTSVIILNILGLVGFVLTFVQCNPAAGQWDPFGHPETKCWNRAVNLLYACTVSGISAIMDLSFSIYPGFMIWQLQMATYKRVAIILLMSLGFASFAFAIIKLDSNTTLLGNPDLFQLLYDGVRIGLWNSIENDFVLSAACLPATPPFFRACRTFVSTYLASSGNDRLNTLNSWIARRSRGPHRRMADPLNTDELLKTEDSTNESMSKRDIMHNSDSQEL